ncbi:MAG: T9SS type A sorting domain-containing protein [Bacteroidetes bacterium]|jgi:hypothetical protein|nr:T9SS type A sorting domain-containing protein [Bacteroidota bacterium]MBT4409434.1 T9SS type A sorting domain-containing protein [Bacteroidota bacterium]MBT5425568.1 T9SS type A sorting domain-containing protein [Bacteroidota bacterium]MBT7462564.1 T9SS type A sorting domain-containing protein [Bacteroidota bacterium]
MLNTKHLLFLLSLSMITLSSMAQVESGKDKDYAAYPHWQDMMLDHSISFFETQKAFNTYWENRTPARGTGYKVFKRWEYLWETLVTPDGKFPEPGHVYNEYSRYAKEHPVSGRMKSGTAVWQELGPKTRQNYGGYVGVGRINAIAFHPTDPETIFAGAPSGGFWYTHNGGASWATSTDTLPTLGVSAILVHPDDPNAILIGTGDDDGGDDQGLGVFKSQDGGLSWEQSNEGMGNVTVNVFAHHDTEPGILLAGTKNSGIYKTEDFGENWTKTNAPDRHFRNLVYKPGDMSVVYASENGFWRSIDSGENWTQIGSDEGLTSTGRMVIDVTKANDSLVYILVGGGPFRGLFQSRDFGQTFTEMSDSPNILGYANDGSDDSSQAGYDLILHADPDNQNVIHAGGINLWKSTNGGTSWTITGHWTGSGTNAVHADQHHFAHNPLNDRIYVGNDGGVYWTANNATTWSEISEGLGIGQMYKIGVAQTNSNKVVAGFQDNGSATLMGNTWLSTGGGDGMECAVDPVDDAWSYTTLYYGDITRRYNNTNGRRVAGEDTYGMTESGAWVTPFCVAENDPNIMIVGMKNLWMSNNIRSQNSVVWNKITNNLGDVNNVNGRVVEHSPADFNIFYYVRGDNKVWRTDKLFDHPAWNEITSKLPGGGSVRDLECHPYEKNTVYMVQGTKVYKSSDKGNSWDNISGSLPDVAMMDIVYDKSSDEGLYVATLTGVFFKNASMEDWVQYGLGLPVSVHAREVEIYFDRTDRNESRLRVGTYGRGLWEVVLAPAEAILPPVLLTASASTGLVELEWQAPFYPQNISDYNVYREEELIATVTGKTYLDREIENDVTYEYYVTANYISIGESQKSNRAQATPLATIYLPYEQDFEIGHGGWNAKFSLDGWNYGRSSELNITGNNGSFFGINSGMAGEGIHVSDYLYTPKIDLSSYANNPVTVRFKYTLRLYMDYDHLYFVWKTPEGDRWNIQEEITKPSGFGWPWAEKEIDLPVEALVADVQFGFLYDDNNEHGWGAGIDDFQLFVNTTSIFDLELASRVTVFPNPNNGHFEVKITDSKPGTLSLEVSDLAGRTIYSKSYPAGTINVSEAIDLTKYSNGLYNLTIRNGNAVYVTKLTIQ